MQQPNLFHNTNFLSADSADRKKAKNKNQADVILELLRKHPDQSFTPAQIWVMLGQQWPLTSVRRAINYLTENGHLEKTDELRPGFYGDPNHCWTLKTIK